LSHEILIKASAEKDIRRLPRDVRERVVSAILALREEPRPPGVRKLKGRGEEGWRIRVGDYRVVYRIDDSLRQVAIYRVRHRRDVYRFSP
jgi:mRNA interferase RelE/StbE